MRVEEYRLRVSKLARFAGEVPERWTLVNVEGVANDEEFIEQRVVIDERHGNTGWLQI